MKLKERVIHSFLFEFFLVILSIVVIKFATAKETTTAVWVSLVISFAAVTWNFVYNLIFDKFFTGDRLKRGIFVRVLHACLYELGFLFFTVPFVAFAMKIDLLTAFYINISITLIVLVYVVVFNWIYDRVRLFFVSK